MSSEERSPAGAWVGLSDGSGEGFDIADACLSCFFTFYFFCLLLLDLPLDFCEAVESGSLNSSGASNVESRSDSGSESGPGSGDLVESGSGGSASSSGGPLIFANAAAFGGQVAITGHTWKSTKVT